MTADDRSRRRPAARTTSRSTLGDVPLTKTTASAGALPSGGSDRERSGRRLYARERDRLRSDAVRFLVHATNALLDYDPLAIALIDTGRALYAIASLDIGTGGATYDDALRALASVSERAKIGNVPDRTGSEQEGR